MTDEGTAQYKGNNAAASGRRTRMVVLTILAATLLTTCLLAARWQYARAGEKEVILAGFSAGLAEDALTRPPEGALPEELRYRRIEISGRFDTNRQILLDSRTFEGAQGYEVLTPLRTNYGVLLVNRGWVKAHPDRRVLPVVPVDGSTRVVSGLLNRLPVPGMRLEADDPTIEDWPRRMLYPDSDTIAAALGEAVPDFQIWLDPELPDGFTREWSPIRTGPATHYGYTMQWLSFAFLTALFYVLLMWRLMSNTEDKQQS